MKTEYKVAYFKCMWDFAKGFHQKLQKTIDENAVDGWKLHSWKLSPMGEWCTVMFVRESEY